MVVTIFSTGIGIGKKLPKTTRIEEAGFLGFSLILEWKLQRIFTVPSWKAQDFFETSSPFNIIFIIYYLTVYLQVHEDERHQAERVAVSLQCGKQTFCDIVLEWIYLGTGTVTVLSLSRKSV
jgi:hypothetical protein